MMYSQFSRTLRLPVTIIFSSLLFISCNNKTPENNSTNDSTLSGKMKEMGNDIKAGADTVAKEAENLFSGSNPDSAFLTVATVSNIKELEMLKTGVSKGTSAALKSDAKMMRADHLKLGEQVKKYAAGIHFDLPQGDMGKADEDLNKLSGKTGDEWDKGWVNDMIDDHEDAVHTFEKFQDKVKDPELKNMITNALPTLRSHLDMVRKLKDNLK